MFFPLPQHKMNLQRDKVSLEQLRWLPLRSSRSSNKPSFSQAPCSAVLGYRPSLVPPNEAKPRTCRGESVGAFTVTEVKVVLDISSKEKGRWKYKRLRYEKVSEDSLVLDRGFNLNRKMFIYAISHFISYFKLQSTSTKNLYSNSCKPIFTGIFYNRRC